ncbi:MAG: hypothetical protein K2X48_02080 [Chitinophagaceae bacterium]|nr:hypothetical protein [Chitinophagaceae bacterium]
MIIANGQSKSISFGAGPTVSLFYWRGGPIKNWGGANVNNIAPQRKNMGVSFAFQYNKEVKKNVDYFLALSYDTYGIKYKNKFQRDNFLVDVDTREDYTTIFFSAGLERKFKAKKWDINVALGLYTFVYFDQQIDLAPYFDNNTGAVIYKTSVANRWGNEAGAQLGLRIMYPLNKQMKIGINPVYFQTISALGAEKISANFICAINL